MYSNLRYAGQEHLKLNIKIEKYVAICEIL